MLWEFENFGPPWCPAAVSGSALVKIWAVSRWCAPASSHPASYIVHIVAPCFVAQRTPFFLHTVLHTMWPFAHIWVSFSLDTIILQDSFSSGESPALLCSSHINYFLCLHFIFERWMLHVTALHNTYVLWPWKKFQEHPWKYPCKYFPHRTHSTPPLRTLRCNNYRGTMMLVDPGWEITCQSWREGSPGQSTVTSLWWCNICKHTKSCQYHNIIWCDSVTTQPLELRSYTWRTDVFCFRMNPIYWPVNNHYSPNWKGKIVWLPSSPTQWGGWWRGRWGCS